MAGEKEAAFSLALKFTLSARSVYSCFPTGHNQPNIPFSAPRGALQSSSHITSASL